MHARLFAIGAAASLLVGSSAIFARQEAAPAVEFSAAFGPPSPVAREAPGTEVRLRRGPSARSPVVGALSGVPDEEFIRVSRVSGGFALAGYKDAEGWAPLDEATPVTMALALDPRSGATVARAAVGPGQRSVAFSPDGSRAIFYGCSSVVGDECAAREFRTSDLEPTRTIRPDARDAPQPDVLAVFYGGPDGAPYAVLGGSSDSGVKRIAIVRVHEPGARPEPPVLLAVGSNFLVSGDGRLGFLLDPEGLSPDAESDGPTFRVFDLSRLETRTVIRMPAGRLFDFGRDFVPSYDGSKLFLLGDVKCVRVVDVATGKISREIPTGWRTDGDDAWLKDVCSGGRAHLLAADGFAGDLPEGAWWFEGDRLSRGPANLAAAADTGAARYGVDRDGRRLYTLGPGERTTRPRPIARPDAGRGDPLLVPEALIATPGGSRLILVLADPEVLM
jgi:hypothetical protein